MIQAAVGPAVRQQRQQVTGFRAAGTTSAVSCGCAALSRQTLTPHQDCLYENCNLTVDTMGASAAQDGAPIGVRTPVRRLATKLQHSLLTPTPWLPAARHVLSSPAHCMFSDTSRMLLLLCLLACLCVAAAQCPLLRHSQSPPAPRAAHCW